MINVTSVTFDDIEAIAASAEPIFDIDALFDSFDDRANDYPFAIEDDLAFVESEIAEIEAIMRSVGDDLADNFVNEGNLSALYAHREELRQQIQGGAL